MKPIYLLSLILIISCDPQTTTRKTACLYRDGLSDIKCIDFNKSRAGYFIGEAEVAEKLDNYRNNFRIKNSNSQALWEMDTLIMKHIEEFYGKVKDHSPDNFITGIKITYGMDVRGKIIRLYQLWYIKNAIIEDKELTGNVRYVNRLEYYRYTKANGFEIVSATNVQRWIDNLIDNMEIRRIKNSEFSAPRYTSDWTSDTESSFYSFQELFYLYRLNYSKNSECDDLSCMLIVKEGASHKSESLLWKKRYKLATIFATIPSDRKDDPEEGDEANLGHLCPPKCNGLTYPIE